MKISKKIPTAGAPTLSVERRLWQVACQWVWNLRLTLGKTMQGDEVREIEWAPPKAAPPFLVTEESPPEEYGPWQWAAAFGRATGRITSRCLRLTRKRDVALSSGGQSPLRVKSVKRMPSPNGLFMSPPRLIVRTACCGSNVWQKVPKAIVLAASVRSADCYPLLHRLSKRRAFWDRYDG
jgi:hypothetical protein